MKRERNAVRAVITETRCILLMQMAFPWRDQPIWIAPGGGLLPGESARAGLLRELYEETGKGDFEIGLQLYARTIEIQLQDGPMLQHERYFHVACSRFTPSTRKLEQNERGWFRMFQWTRIDALAVDPSIEAGKELYAALTALSR